MSKSLSTRLKRLEKSLRESRERSDALVSGMLAVLSGTAEDRERFLRENGLIDALTDWLMSKRNRVGYYQRLFGSYAIENAEATEKVVIDYEELCAAFVEGTFMQKIEAML